MLNFDSLEEIFRILTSIDLKYLNSYVEYNYFKMESLFLLNELLEQAGLSLQTGFKNAYCSVSLRQDSKKYVKFQWKQ